MERLHFTKGLILSTSKVFLLLLICIVISRCAKDRLINNVKGLKTLSASSPDLANRLLAIKNSYVAQGLHQKIQPNLSEKLTWTPDWKNPRIQVVNDTVSYVFFRLIAQVKQGGKSFVATEIGAASYLMVKNEKEFYKAFYFRPTAGENDTPSREILNMQNFSGNLLVTNLKDGKNFLLEYSNGELSVGYQKKKMLSANKLALNGPPTISYWESQCRYEMRECTYVSSGTVSCGGTFGFEVVYSEYCNFPSPICGVAFWLSDYADREVCVDVWFPDPPTNPGDGGSGNNGSTGTTAEQFNQRINLSSLSPCASSIMYSLMYQTEGSVVAMIQKFSGEVPGYTWNLSTGTLAANTNATTSKITGGASTKVDVDKYTTGRDLALARTLLHEAVHAYLVSYFSNNPILAQLSYPDMVLEWQKVKKPDLNAIQHIEMTIEFKNDIAAGLREYGDLHNITFSTATEKDQFYSDMAWGGLEATPAYQQLNSTDKNRIQDTLNAEQYGKDRKGDPKSGKGNPSGC